MDSFQEVAVRLRFGSGLADTLRNRSSSEPRAGSLAGLGMGVQTPIRQDDWPLLRAAVRPRDRRALNLTYAAGREEIGRGRGTYANPGKKNRPPLAHS